MPDATGFELACAAHFALEAAMYAVGAQSGCILVAGSGTGLIRRSSQQPQAVAKALQQGSQREGEENDSSSSAAFDPQRATASWCERFLERHLPATAPDDARLEASLRIGEASLRLDSSVARLGTADASVSRASRPRCFFRCIAVSGVPHPVFSNEPLLTAVIDTSISLNNSAKDAAFLCMPLRRTGKPASECLGLLLVAYKHGAPASFSEEDEAVLQASAQSITFMLARCAAMQFVEPYDIRRLKNLDLVTLPSEPTALPTMTGCAERIKNGLVFRSATATTLSKRGLLSAATSEIPTAASLQEVSALLSRLEALVENQRTEASVFVEEEGALQRRLRNLRRDLQTASASELSALHERDVHYAMSRSLRQQLDAAMQSSAAVVVTSSVGGSREVQAQNAFTQKQAEDQVMKELEKALSSMSAGRWAPPRSADRRGGEQNKQQQQRHAPRPPVVAPSRLHSANTSRR